jgi:hypothetical protein
VGRSGSPLAHVPEPTSTNLTLLLVEKGFLFASMWTCDIGKDTDSRISANELRIRIWFRIRIVLYHFDTSFSGGKSSF